MAELGPNPRSVCRRSWPTHWQSVSENPKAQCGSWGYFSSASRPELACTKAAVGRTASKLILLYQCMIGNPIAGIRSCKEAMQRRYNLCTFANRRGDTFDRTRADVADGEDARTTCLQQ